MTEIKKADSLKISPEGQKIFTEQINKAKSMPFKPNNYVISFPRSGRTALFLFLEKYTGKPIGRPIPSILKKIDGHDYVFGGKRNVKNVSLSKIKGEPFIIKAHRFKEVDIRPGDNVIFLLRDYRSCIPSLLRLETNEFADWLKNKKGKYYGYENYISFLTALFYKTWNEFGYIEQINIFDKLECHKLLIYYEDFINDFKNTAKRIIDFLDLEYNESKLEQSNIVNKEGRKLVDDFFLETKGRRHINKGCMEFEKEYHGILGEKEIAVLRYCFMAGLQEKNYLKYLGRYEND